MERAQTLVRAKAIVAQSAVIAIVTTQQGQNVGKTVWAATRQKILGSMSSVHAVKLSLTPKAVSTKDANRPPFLYNSSEIHLVLIS